MFLRDLNVIAFDSVIQYSYFDDWYELRMHDLRLIDSRYILQYIIFYTVR